MKKVITYGTFDLLHYGHIKLLERAKELGDYLIVGITSDDYDRTRGKINNQQCLAERIQNVKETGLADLIIIEEYEGQKIDDIKRYDIDIFTVGSDWEGFFDYLKEYCEVIYLPRTKGVSSTQLRCENRELKMGIVSDSANYISKFQKEDKYVNGIEFIGICTNNLENMSKEIKSLPIITNNYDELLNKVDALFIKSDYEKRYYLIKKALIKGKSVLCESPISINKKECEELFELAENNDCVLVEGIRTAYSTAYERLQLLIKSGKIGKILNVSATCTSMTTDYRKHNHSLYEWGSNALLPVFQILGTEYKNRNIITYDSNGDAFTKIDFLYDNACATIIVAEGAKSEGSLVITGTKGYIYVPAPWWKTDYFEVRYENTNENKRYFYQLDGEGIRYELVEFARAVKTKKSDIYISKNISMEICKIMEDFKNDKDINRI